jgi:hypothetical protein
MRRGWQGIGGWERKEERKKERGELRVVCRGRSLFCCVRRLVLRRGGDGEEGENDRRSRHRRPGTKAVHAQSIEQRRCASGEGRETRRAAAAEGDAEAGGDGG